MSKTALSTPDAPGAIGPYSQGIGVPGLVFTSGQLPIDPKTGDMPGDIKAQARVALANVAAILKAGGSDLSKAVKLTVFLTDIADFAAINDVYKEVFAGAEPYPARSAVQVAALPKPGAKVEIEAVGVTA
ncbi:MAG: Rid family detoxifying hydrolase [Deltaproteobacteria bacterium]|nr:Rid family detoxifying hydrolase [Deltaproteobacteria bacterium]